MQIINHTTPDYCIKVLKQNDVDTGVELVYPGTNRTTLQARVEIDDDSNCSNANGYISLTRYNQTMNVEFLDFRVKSELIQNHEQIQGKDYSRIMYGGIYGLEVEPSALHTSGYVGTWGMNNDVYTEAYNTNPWDDFYLNEFYTRMHVNYSSQNPTPVFTDIPLNAKYSDGDYSIDARILDINLDQHTSPDYSFTLDNFLPFITSFHLYSDAGTLFEYNRTQDENGNTLDNGLLTIAILPFN